MIKWQLVAGTLSFSMQGIIALLCLLRFYTGRLRVKLSVGFSQQTEKILQRVYLWIGLGCMGMAIRRLMALLLMEHKSDVALLDQVALPFLITISFGLGIGYLFKLHNRVIER